MTNGPLILLELLYNSQPSLRSERAIAFAAIVGRLAGTSVTAIEQPLTESDAVGAGAVAEEAIVADTMEAVWQSV